MLTAPLYGNKRNNTSADVGEMSPGRNLGKGGGVSTRPHPGGGQGRHEMDSDGLGGCSAFRGAVTSHLYATRPAVTETSLSIPHNNTVLVRQ